ncbi:MAG TPA: tetratricopeptide repeat protein [Bdellovibrionales bacterium]|nr:tetratricopeptide repeat protein [Bdellovibrionales bacterium]
MAYVDHKELLDTARKKFADGDYKGAETVMHQLLMVNNRIPEVFQMLATIYYDRGQFSKAIKHFQRALEIDPTYTEASVGLSIILNDMGRYEEGKQVFMAAQRALDEAKKKQADPYLEEKLIKQHMQLGDLYFQYQRYAEALEQFYKAFALKEKPEIRLRIIDCYAKKGDLDKAIKELKVFVNENPTHSKAQIWLGVLLYNTRRIADAVDQWEKVLFREPQNEEAKKYIRQAQQTRTTEVF